MAAARVQRDVLQMFYGPITREANINLRQSLQPQRVASEGFKISQNNFQDWLRVWRINVNNRDLFEFKREKKRKFTNIVENEIQNLNSVKVSFGVVVNFTRERNGETQNMTHFFQEREPHVHNRHDNEELINILMYSLKQ